MITVPATSVGSPLAINQGTLNSISGVSVADPDINQGARKHLFDVELSASGTGTITLGTITGLDFVSIGTLGAGAGDGSPDTFMRFQGNSTDVNNALASLKYQNAFNGAATITVTVSDQGNSGTDPGVSGGPNDERDSKTIFLNVTQVNTPPVNFVPGADVNEDTTLTFSAPANQISFADAENTGSNNYEMTLSVANGSLLLAQTTGLACRISTQTGSSTMRFQGTLPAINLALDNDGNGPNGLKYTPNANFNGADVFSLSRPTT